MTVASEETQNPRRKLWFVLRAVLGLLILGIVIRSIDLDELGDTLARAQLGWVLLLIGLVVLAVYVSTLRWKFLLQIQGVEVSLWQLFNFYMVSQFFRMIVPGFFTSDIFRLVDIRQSTQQTAVGLASILLERISGVFVLCAVGAVAALAAPELSDYPSIRLLTVLLFFASVVAFGLLLYPFFLRFVLRFVRWQRLRDFIQRLETATTLYRTSPTVVPKTLLYSAVIQVIGMVAFYVQIVAFGIHVSFVDAIAIAPIAVVATLIPLSPGALGLQEGVYIVLMGAIGISAPSALAASLLARAANLLVGMWGGIYYFFYR